MTADWLDEIEAQIDGSVPHYVPRLVSEIRRLRVALAKVRQEASPCPCEFAGETWHMRGICEEGYKQVPQALNRARPGAEPESRAPGAESGTEPAPTPYETGLCCMSAHANATPPWTCSCPCYGGTEPVQEEP